MSQSYEADPSTNLTSEEFQAVKKIVHSFISAFKYYSLYPQDHAFSQNHLQILFNNLRQFLGKHQSLRLDIEKYSFTYKGKPLIRDSVDENSPVYLLTRDSILYIEFTGNIQLQEIATFFDILNKHRNPLEEVEGDIATSLWHIPFNNIHYEAADIFAMDAIDFDLSMFNPRPGSEHPPAEGAAADDGSGDEPGNNPPQNAQFGNHDGSDQHYAGFYDNEYAEGMASGEGPDSSSPGLLHIAGESDLAELTGREKLMLESHVQQELERDVAGDAIDILLIILSIETDRIEFATLLDLLEFEYFDALAREQYHLANKICRNVKNISNAVGSRREWAVSLINMFFSSLAGEDRYQPLPMLTEIDHFAHDPDRLKYLLSAFDMLPAESVGILVSLAGKTSSDNLRQRNELLGIIEKKAGLAPQNLLQILEKADEGTCLFLFPVIESMDPAAAGRMYLGMTRKPFPSARRIGLDGLFQGSGVNDPEDLVHLLGDEDEQIRERIFSYLETLDGNRVEETIIRFLQSETAGSIEPLHVLQCYRILGGCLSDRSVEFLREVLLGSRITGVFSRLNLVHKKGAAYALLLSGRQDAREIVHKGAASVRPDVRHACQKILDHS